MSASGPISFFTLKHHRTDAQVVCYEKVRCIDDALLSLRSDCTSRRCGESSGGPGIAVSRNSLP